MASESLIPEVTDWQPGGDGILPSQEIRHFIKVGIVSSSREPTDDQIQPASIDLRLSNEAYRVRASFLPGKSTTLLNKATSNGMLNQKIDISLPSLLEPNVIYIIPLMESLNLPDDVYGIANPKSTTGRLDIFTRLITEHGDEFDRVGKGYRGKLYIEVISHTFPVVVRAGLRLNQLRFGRGSTDVASDARLKKLGREDLLIGADESSGAANIDRGVRITVDLVGNGSGIIAYQARKCSPPIELDKIDYYEIAEFWNPISRERNRSFILEPGEFYILASKQRVRVPPDFAAEMLPYDLATQEFRVHYAGFFDPGFGFGTNGGIPGTRAVLEVRASEIPILLEDDQFVGRLNYFSMAATPDKVYGGPIGSSYQQQGLALSKQFKRESQFMTGIAPISAAEQESQEALRRRNPSRTQPAAAEDDDDASILRLAFPDTGAEQRISTKEL